MPFGVQVRPSIDVRGGGARGARAPPAVGLEILSGLKPWRKKEEGKKKKRKKENKKKERMKLK